MAAKRHDTAVGLDPGELEERRADIRLYARAAKETMIKAAKLGVSWRSEPTQMTEAQREAYDEMVNASAILQSHCGDYAACLILETV